MELLHNPRYKTSGGFQRRL